MDRVATMQSFLRATVWKHEVIHILYFTAQVICSCDFVVIIRGLLIAFHVAEGDFAGMVTLRIVTNDNESAKAVPSLGLGWINSYGSDKVKSDIKGVWMPYPIGEGVGQRPACMWQCPPKVPKEKDMASDAEDSSKRLPIIMAMAMRMD